MPLGLFCTPGALLCPLGLSCEPPLSKCTFLPCVCALGAFFMPHGILLCSLGLIYIPRDSFYANWGFCACPSLSVLAPPQAYGPLICVHVPLPVRAFMVAMHTSKIAMCATQGAMCASTIAVHAP